MTDRPKVQISPDETEGSLLWTQIEKAVLKGVYYFVAGVMFAIAAATSIKVFLWLLDVKV